MRNVNTKKADFVRSQPLIPFEKGTSPRTRDCFDNRPLRMSIYLEEDLYAQPILSKLDSKSFCRLLFIE